MAARDSQDDQGRKMAARRDAVLVAVISLLAAVVCVKLDLSETLLGWTRLHERLQLDELPAVLLVVATCLIWFSARRYFEARGQLVLRRATEVRLEEALAENQRLAQQYLDIQEYERKALARDLHDELGQYLNVIKLDAVSIRDARQPPDPLVNDAARALIENVDRVYGVVSSLIRQLRPVGFDELGVAAALEHCVDDWRARLPALSIDFSIDRNAFDAIDEIRALAVFRLVQEALTNIARHAQATCVEIRIRRRRQSGTQETVEVSIIDNGSGADLNAPRTGLGLVGMRERVAAFGGSLELASRRGAGFKVMASLPVAAAPSAGRYA
ncbi:MAG TPA: sensor histidine kinase [Steroidobacteraceae bacterium]|nr:sensor histidine kinase [Steroidobacteraceae bacterium]